MSVHYIAAVPLDVEDPLLTLSVLDAHLVALGSSIENAQTENSVLVWSSPA